MSEKLNMKWSLKELYPSFEDESFHKDIEILGEEISSIKTWISKELKEKERAKEKLEYFINWQNKFYAIYTRLSSFCHLTLSADAKNEKAQKYSEIIQNKYLEFTPCVVSFNKWISNLENIEELLEASDILKEHKYYIEELIEKSKYLLSDKEENIISRMKTTGSTAWENLQKLLTSTQLVSIELEGEMKKVPLTVLKNMLFDENPELRKKAYECELESYKAIEEPIAAALNGIKGEVITVSSMKGYKDPLEYTLVNSRMNEETLNSMLEAIEESLPYFTKYYLKKAEILGHKGALPYYDIFAPIGGCDKKYSYEEARDFIVENFNRFSENMGSFASNAFENRWIDSEARNGKRGGAFCSNLHCIKESRILCTFNGSFKNVSTLAHELGHGYHGSILAKESHLNSKYPMPIAETASLFCETLVRDAAIKNSEKNIAFSILEGEITNCSQVIVDIYARFLFEKEFFKRRKENSLPLEEIKSIMLEAQRKAYGKGVDENTLNPYAWINKPHYYYAERNFYNFPYAFGLLFAKGLYSQYLKAGYEFVKEYDKLLSVTGKAKVKDVALSVGIDVQDIDFWRSSLNIVKADIDKFIELSKEFI